MCGKDFDKDAKEHKRRLKAGHTRFFCSQSCVCTKSNEEHPRKGDASRLIAGNRRDEHTPFRWFVARAIYRDRKKHYGCDITTEYLKSLWDLQEGKCPFTGWSLILPHDIDGWEEYHPANASVDRIDNSKGYMQGNVRFISVMANLARQSFSDIQLIDFCKAVANYEMAPSR